MSGRDDDTKRGRPGAASIEEDDGARVPAVTEAEERAVDAAVRALRDAPVPSERLARMRAGLDARIAAAERSGVGGDAAGDGGAPVLPIDAHPRWSGRRLAAAAALAAAVLLGLLLARNAERAGPRAPLEVAEDAPSRPAPAPDAPTGRAVSPVAPQEVAGDATPGTAGREATGGAAPEATGLGLAGEAAPASPPLRTPSELEAASDEELAVALEYERLADYDVIAQLELLELLDELAAEGRI